MNQQVNNGARASPAMREAEVADRFLILPDPRDRLAEILAAAGALPRLPEGERAARDLVPGCSARLWLATAWPGGRLQARVDSDSAMVRALAWLICQVYSGAEPAEAADWETRIIERLGLDRILSPTRLNGLANVVARLRARGREAMETGGSCA